MTPIGQYQGVTVHLPNDGRTSRLWRWERGENHQSFVRLTTTASMEQFHIKENRWIPLDDYYFRRATQDPEFVEIDVQPTNS